MTYLPHIHQNFDYFMHFWELQRQYLFKINNTILRHSFTGEEVQKQRFALSSGSMDEGVTEGLQSMQGTPNTTGHMEEDER